MLKYYIFSFFTGSIIGMLIVMYRNVRAFEKEEEKRNEHTRNRN